MIIHTIGEPRGGAIAARTELTRLYGSAYGFMYVPRKIRLSNIPGKAAGTFPTNVPYIGEIILNGDYSIPLGQSPIIFPGKYKNGVVYAHNLIKNNIAQWSADFYVLTSAAERFPQGFGSVPIYVVNNTIMVGNLAAQTTIIDLGDIEADFIVNARVTNAASASGIQLLAGACAGALQFVTLIPRPPLTAQPAFPNVYIEPSFTIRAYIIAIDRGGAETPTVSVFCSGKIDAPRGNV